MIGFIEGRVLFSDGLEVVVQTRTGVGYQVYHQYIVPEGSPINLFVSHIIRETSQELYGFRNLREKKLFELLNSVKGVGPKSAYALINSLGTKTIIEAIEFENKKSLTKAPGIGQKAASQIILDLQSKVFKVAGYSNLSVQVSGQIPSDEFEALSLTKEDTQDNEELGLELSESSLDPHILQDVIMACKELGFKEDKVTPVAYELMQNNAIKKSEQLLHLVLKEM